MGIYEKAPAEVKQVCERVMKSHHFHLHALRVTVDLWFIAADEESDEPALKLHGYACFAVCKINPPKLRAQGHGDAEITIDKEAWESLDSKSRDALVDHELEHLHVRVDKEGNPTFDQYERPKLGLFSS